jgi:hypothetical protein
MSLESKESPEGHSLTHASTTPSIVTSSLPSSRRTSYVHPLKSPRGDEYSDVKCEVMVNWLHMQQKTHQWVAKDSYLCEGVILRQSKQLYLTAPSTLSGSELEDAVRSLNVQVAMTMNTTLISIILKHNEDASFIEVRPGHRLQVLPDITYLSRCRKNQFAAFVSDPGFLIVWEDQPENIVQRVEKIEAAMVQMLWGTSVSLDERDKNSFLLSTPTHDMDLEAVDSFERHRQISLVQPFMSACTVAMTILAIASGWRHIAVETAVNGTFMRIIFILAFIPQFWLSLVSILPAFYLMPVSQLLQFFCQSAANAVAQLVGPIGQYKQNTKYYSGSSPKRLDCFNETLPHVTIQCPVYKEGLHTVIEPTIRSVKQAISTYEMQGGTANIFINDDGMRLIPKQNAEERREFYDEHNIGWVARPEHNPNPNCGTEAFFRRGKFKKASNMNYALWISQRIEETLDRVSRSVAWTQDDEWVEYGKALNDVVNEDEGKTWASGNIRMGDYILIIDCDTRVPEDCLLDAVSEMEQSSQVAVMQYSSGVMNVTASFFERAITFFTNLIYTAIRYAVANGDVAPFVGHNAILRWSAVQEIAYICPMDKREKYWSEDTVSEDFDMALRLQTTGYICRLAAYTGEGFKEGVSLTVYDELTRWEKYAYGCNELVFHPVHQWAHKGPFTNLFRSFIVSSIPFPAKITIMAYIGTYYALGSSWILTIFNYFVIGWFNGYYDHYYTDSWKIIVAVIAVFTVSGNVALAVFRYRVEEKPLIGGITENFKWIPVFFIFFGGVSLHVSQALLCHMFGINMGWGATSKEVEDITFFEEIPRVIKRFKGTFILTLLLTVMMVFFADFAPDVWRINSLIAIFPLALVTSCHFLIPIVLNPNLMLFTW